MFVSSRCPDSAVAVPPKPLASATLLGSWQAVHDQLLGGLDAANPAGAAVYAYCMYRACGTSAARAWAQELAQHLAAQFWPGPGGPWVAPLLGQAGALAWLYAQFIAAGLPPFCTPMQLASLDSCLFQQAQAALMGAQSGFRDTLGRVTRYLTLRLPAPAAVHYLQTLVAQWPALPTEEPVLLGLDGLAAEVMTLLRLHKAGLHHPTMQARIRQGIQYLLASRRAVDFQQQQYAIFPYEQAAAAQDAKFSAELSWQRGDLVQAWLLYEAHGVLHDTELAHIAELVGLHTVLRTTEPTTTIASANFYDGAAGVAHRYAQLYQTSGLAAYRAAYQFWLSRTQELFPLALANTSSAPQPTAETQCLEGLVGVGLVLLAAVKNLTIKWEAALAW